MVKNSPTSAGDIRDMGLIPGPGRSPGGGQGNPPQCSCLENPHGQRNLVSYSPWGHKELDMTERLSTAQPCFTYIIEFSFRKNLIILLSFQALGKEMKTNRIFLFKEANMRSI